MRKFLLFGGTTEGRILAEYSFKLGLDVTVCVATSYGRDLLPCKQENLHVHMGRLDKNEMSGFMQDKDYFCVVDATHPYAIEVSKNIREAAENVGLTYYRMLREESKHSDCIYVDNIAAACKVAKEGNILATTGSKEILDYCDIEDFANKVFIRVLPTAEAIEKCKEYGFKDSHIIAEKGPFSKQQNIEVIKKYNIKTLITKDGGKEGGFEGKINAARSCKIDAIVVKRPIKEEGYSYNQIVEILKEV